MRAHVRPHHGAPTLFLNDQPAFANFHLLSPFDGEYRAPSRPIARKFGQLGIDLYSIDASGPEWIGPGQYDFSGVEPRLRGVLDENPAAHFLFRMNFETRGSPNNWWNSTYPDELELLGAEGDDEAAVAALRSNPPAERRIAQSYASQIWRAQVKDLLRAYIAHLRDIGLYDRVIGFQLGAGVVSEWVKGEGDMTPLCGDYSAPMQRHFRSWLRRTYSHEKTLQQAWGDAQVTFDTADVPAPRRQFSTQHGQFRDPERERCVIDYYICLAELTSDVLLDFCQTVKHETDGDKLAGAFYGYLMELSWNLAFFGFGEIRLDGVEYGTLQRSGHLGLSRVLRSPHFDFFVSPYCYPFRGVGGDGQAMQPSETCRLHGKLYLFEEDTLMHNRFEPEGRMQPQSDTLEIYKRNFAYCLTRGHGITWLQSSIYREYPEIEKESDALLARMQTLGAWATQLDRAPNAEIAVLLDDESYFYSSLRNDLGIAGVFYPRVIDLPRIGAPHDVYLLRDLVEGRLPPYKLYIFLNAYRLSRGQREAIARHVKCAGRTAVWLHAPGYIYDDAAPALDAGNVSGITGIRVRRTEQPWSMHAHVTNVQHTITRDVPQDLFWSAQRSLYPTFFVDDPQATQLGQVVTALGRCKPGLAVREFDGWRSIYSATPSLPAPIWRGIARYAGVHLYSEAGDVLYATRDFLAVHTSAGGARRFQLPHEVRAVVDVFAQREIARTCTSFAVELPRASTTLFYFGDRALPAT